MNYALVVPGRNTSIAMDKDNNSCRDLKFWKLNNFGLQMAFMLLLGALLVMNSGCSKTTDPPDWSYMYRYYPLQEGHWTIFQVDSVAYNSLLDTVMTYRYFIREQNGTSFQDLAGNEWIRVNADITSDTGAQWFPLASYAQRVTRQTAERLENNLRFVKMVYPFKKYSWWAGNSYIHFDDVYNCNFLGEWQYQYKDLYVTKTINGHPFDSVVVIQQVADSGLICKNLSFEMYAPQVGLVYKHTERLTTQKTTSDPFWIRAEDGYILTYTIIDWKRN